MIFSRQFGDPSNPRIVVMHGLCGSSRNWLSVGEALAEKGFCVDLLDARDHGQSEWTDMLNYDVLAQDVIEWWRARGSPAITFVGHSMGGKLGMVLATKQAEVLREGLRRLVVVDIAPKQYDPHYQDALRACLELKLNKLRNRQQADECLAENIPNLTFRQFLLSNLYSNGDGEWRWRCNFELILRDLPNLASNPFDANDISQLPTLFIAGANSSFVEPCDEPLLKRHFPNSQLCWLSTGHNVHIEARETFVEKVVGWINL